MKMLAFTTGLLCAALALPAAAQRMPGPANRGPMALDVAGVRLGMPVAQVRTALAGGWKCRSQPGETTFRQKVEDEVRKRRTGSSGRWGGGEGISSDACVGPGGEELVIRYAEVEGGPIVDGFTLSLSRDRFRREEVIRGLLAKFGRPMRPLADGGGYWCVPGARCSGLLLSEAPIVQVVDASTAVIAEGARGSRARDADQAAVMAAADRQAPKRSNAAF
ncbi:MAG: hypothetical protein DI530_16960 [Sphingomonas sp.]|uniref:hypothetical protein n=1 Tax=Sphingomonas sp. TaxID=28214 RepID=UPI000DBC3632|nr:hypothetical protein [Sphingomonas sp.]PZU73876.1 MAG: hypothetical protein DI530_16960 [Sphingomonas sp.]